MKLLSFSQIVALHQSPHERKPSSLFDQSVSSDACHNSSLSPVGLRLTRCLLFKSPCGFVSSSEMAVAPPVLPPSGCCSDEVGDGIDDKTPNSFLTALATACDKDSVFDCVLLVAAFDLKSSSFCGPDNLFVTCEQKPVSRHSKGTRNLRCVYYAHHTSPTSLLVINRAVEPHRLIVQNRYCKYVLLRGVVSAHLVYSGIHNKDF